VELVGRRPRTTHRINVNGLTPTRRGSRRVAFVSASEVNARRNRRRVDRLIATTTTSKARLAAASRLRPRPPASVQLRSDIIMNVGRVPSSSSSSSSRAAHGQRAARYWHPAPVGTSPFTRLHVYTITLQHCTTVNTIMAATIGVNSSIRLLRSSPLPNF